MTGAMYAAIAGLRTHMQNLNVIGNNVANVNTYGYKSARSVFKTSLYTTLSGGSDGTTVVGGANPSQIGYGATMGSVGIDMSTGNYAVTGRGMDWMLDGDGFFMCSEKTTAQQFDGSGSDQSVLNGMKLTRVGNFEFGADGYLAKEDDGMCVYGFLCVGYDDDGHAVFSDQLVPIRYPMVETKTTTTEVDGVQTVKKEATVLYPRTGDDNHIRDAYAGEEAQPDVEVENNGGNNNNNPGTGTGDAETKLSRGIFSGITIDKNTGIITGTCDDTKELVTIGIIAVGRVVNPNGVTNLGDNYYQAGQGSGGVAVGMLGGSASSALGKLYMNQSILNGDNNAQPDDAPDCCRLRDCGETRVLANGLEMSKTDLAQEISQMILTQRGYQANTRIITVTDSMLEELVNMKR